MTPRPCSTCRWNCTSVSPYWGERANKLGTALTRTVTAYNQFASSLESRVLVTARKLQRVDQSKVIGTVDMIAPEKGDIRELSAPETNAE
mgnify:CR=1 FL=1